MFNIQSYNEYMRKFCETIKLDYFPQMQASDLLYKVIMLQDLYMPAFLYKPINNPFKYNVDYSGMQERYVPSNPSNNDLDIDALIAKIDAKIAELEEQERKEKERRGSECGSEIDVNSTSKTEDDIDKKSARLSVEDEEEAWVEKRVSFDELDVPSTLPSNLIIQAAPGSGKTSFCKRLILALIDRDFDYLETNISSRTSMKFKGDFLPVFMMFRNIANLKELLCNGASFEKVLYCFTCNIFDERFAEECSFEDFSRLLSEGKEKTIYLVIDGWDELFDTELQKILEDELNRYVTDKNNVSIVFTIRTQYQLPSIFGDGENCAVYEIKKLETNDINEYCRKYYEVIYREDEEKRNSYKSVAENIIKMSKVNPQILHMAQIPLTLSQLLTLSRYDGCLPENKSELYNDLLDLYVGWATKKNTNNISHNKMRKLLAYIATYLTKNNKFLCSIDELKGIIRACVTDLSGTFPGTMNDNDILKLIAELDHTAVFGKGLNDSYGFVEHRTMQEYLTAYAIVTQNADEEYNEMMPLDIFSDKYEMKRWREVIVYAVLMDDGRLRQGIINDLIRIAKEKADDNYVYTNLLFEFISNSVPMKPEVRHQIYDLLFQKHITDNQITNIHKLMMLENDVTRDFSEYIKEKFQESVRNGNSEYGYAMAVIESSKILEEFNNFYMPVMLNNRAHAYLLNKAERLIVEGDEWETILGYQILLIIAWCKYENIRNEFSSGASNYKFSDAIIKRTKELIRKEYHADDVAKSIKDCVLAGFVSFEDLVDEDMYKKLIDALNQNKYYAEVYLSLGPVRDCMYVNDEGGSISTDIQDKYEERLSEEISEMKLDEIIFTYSICTLFNSNYRDVECEMWRNIKSCYESKKNSGGFGGARYKQIDMTDQRKRSDTNLLRPDFASLDLELSNGKNKPVEEYKEQMIKEGMQTIEFSFGNRIYVARYRENDVSTDGKSFVTSFYHRDTISTKNNLAYLYRRGEISGVVRLENGSWIAVDPKELLREGVNVKEPFSLVNNALILTCYEKEVDKDSVFIGLDFIINHAKNRNNYLIEWQEVLGWWKHVLADVDEIEGLIVFYWLYKIGNINLNEMNNDFRERLSSAYMKNQSLFEDEMFTKIMMETIA